MINIPSTKLYQLISGAGLAAISLAMTAGSASAGTLTFTYSSSGTFNGSTPTSPSPFLTALFEDDIPANNQVRLTITAGLTGTEFVDEIVFNYNPSKTVSNGVLKFDFSSGVASQAITQSANSVTLQGSGNKARNFDISIPYAANTLTNGQSVFIITSSEGVRAQDFNYQKPTDNFSYSGVHIQGISGSSGAVVSAQPVYNSGGVSSGVPEPLTILGATTAAGFGALFKRKLAKAQKS